MTPEPIRTPVAGRNLPLAIGVGLGLAVLFIGTLLVDPWAFLVFFTVLAVLGVSELDHAFRLQGLRPAAGVAYAAAVLCMFGAYAYGPPAQTLAMVVTVVGSMASLMLDRQRTRVTASVAATCLMVLWVPFLASFVGLLLARPEHGEWLVMAAVALTVTNDIGAYAIGSRFGRHKLAPGISPAKSWEGFAGGLGTVVLVAAFGTSRIPGMDGDVAAAVLLGVAVAVAGTLGDLAESLVKRDLGVKDLGRILPGHGGIMERADAIIFAVPVAHFVFVAVGR